MRTEQKLYDEMQEFVRELNSLVDNPKYKDVPLTGIVHSVEDWVWMMKYKIFITEQKQKKLGEVLQGKVK